MRTSYLLTLGLLLVASGGVYGQTKLVAHRSHSGSLGTFSTKGAGNFGEFIHFKRIVRVVKLTDTSAIEVSNEGLDTTRNHHYWNNPKIKVDSLRKLFPDISFEGYDRPAKPIAAVTAPVSASQPGGILSLALLSSTVMFLVAGGIWQSQRRRDTV
jgi:hypothetical protein